MLWWEYSKIEGEGLAKTGLRAPASFELLSLHTAPLVIAQAIQASEVKVNNIFEGLRGHTEQFALSWTFGYS